MVYSWVAKPMIASPLCVFDPTQCLKGASVLAISFAEHSCNTRMSGCKLITASRFFSNPILKFQETISIRPRLECSKPDAILKTLHPHCSPVHLHNPNTHIVVLALTYPIPY